jgi:hypothetical protein
MVQLICRDGRSLLQYVEEAFPYTTTRDEPARRRIAELARDVQQAIGRLIRHLQRNHVTPPVLGAFPSAFTTINFVALEHLLPALQKDEERSVAQLERVLALLVDSDERRLLWDYLEMKRRHLQVLQELGRLEAAATGP